MKYQDTIVLIQLFIIRILIKIDTEFLGNVLKQVRYSKNLLWPKFMKKSAKID